MLKSLDKIHDISRQASDQSTRNDYKVHISEIEKGQNYIQELKYNLNRINYIERKAAARPYKEKNEELKRKLAASASSIIRKIHLIDGLTLIHKHWRTVPIEKGTKSHLMILPASSYQENIIHLLTTPTATNRTLLVNSSL